MKMAIIFHSESGNTECIAEIMEKEASKIPEMEAKSMNLADLDESFIKESQIVIFGCPTYCGTMSWQMKKFLDTTSIPLKDKMGSVFATENYIGGGADFAELTMIGCLLVRGMLVYTGGAAKQPFTHFGAVVIKKGDEPQVERVRAFVRKIAVKAAGIFR